eukprot:TRINITY_DN2706_c1_g1_i3.p1 TRINITY_DN2706_c1_g1~~TRINITY_DN2706_c1_g1_i3.p1  ORF type:complete len:726 (+),score=217.74 TRINITY_DN2706_c1_g1_i3:64-2178(+)
MPTPPTPLRPSAPPTSRGSMECGSAGSGELRWAGKCGASASAAEGEEEEESPPAASSSDHTPPSTVRSPERRSPVRSPHAAACGSFSESWWWLQRGAAPQQQQQPRTQQSPPTRSPSARVPRRRPPPPPPPLPPPPPATPATPAEERLSAAASTSEERVWGLLERGGSESVELLFGGEMSVTAEHLCVSQPDRGSHVAAILDPRPQPGFFAVPLSSGPVCKYESSGWAVSTLARRVLAAALSAAAAAVCAGFRDGGARAASAAALCGAAVAAAAVWSVSVRAITVSASGTGAARCVVGVTLLNRFHFGLSLSEFEEACAAVEAAVRRQGGPPQPLPDGAAELRCLCGERVLADVCTPAAAAESLQFLRRADSGRLYSTTARNVLATATAVATAPPSDRLAVSRAACGHTHLPTVAAASVAMLVVVGLALAYGDAKWPAVMLVGPVLLLCTHCSRKVWTLEVGCMRIRVSSPADAAAVLGMAVHDSDTSVEGLHAARLELEGPDLWTSESASVTSTHIRVQQRAGWPWSEGEADVWAIAPCAAVAGVVKTREAAAAASLRLQTAVFTVAVGGCAAGVAAAAVAGCIRSAGWGYASALLLSSSAAAACVWWLLYRPHGCGWVVTVLLHGGGDLSFRLGSNEEVVGFESVVLPMLSAGGRCHRPAKRGSSGAPFGGTPKHWSRSTSVRHRPGGSSSRAPSDAAQRLR